MAIVVRAPDPLSENGNQTENWEEWKADFLLYLDMNCKEYSNEIKGSLLKQYIGKFGEQIVNKITENMKDKNNLTILLSELDKYFSVPDKHWIPKNEIIERYNFFKAPRTTESIQNYIAYLRRRASACNFGVMEDSLIRDKVILEVKDNDLRRKLFKEEDLDLPKLVTIWKKHEFENIRRKDDTSKTDNNTDNASIKDNEDNVKTAATNNMKKDRIVPTRNDNNDTDNTSTEDEKDNVKTTSNNNIRKKPFVPKKNDDNNTDNASVGDTKNRNNASSNSNQSNDTQFRGNCWRCNKKHPIKSCPAWGSKCDSCNNYHHYTHQCPLKRLDKKRINDQNAPHNIGISESHFQQPSAPPLFNTAVNQLYPRLPTQRPGNHLADHHLNTLHRTEGHRDLSGRDASWSWLVDEGTKELESLRRSVYAPPPRKNRSTPDMAEEAIKTRRSNKGDPNDKCVLQ